MKGRQHYPVPERQPQSEMKVEAALAEFKQGCSKGLLKTTLILCLQGGYADALGTQDGLDQLGLYSGFAGNSGNFSSGSTHQTSAQDIFADHSYVNVQRIKNDQNYTMEGKRRGRGDRSFLQL